MLHRKTTLFFVASLLAIASNVAGKGNMQAKENKLLFTENKGQIKDQNGNARADIQFVLQSPGMSVYIGSGQFHYQFAKCTEKNLITPKSLLRHLQNDEVGVVDECAPSGVGKVNMYRMDVSLLGANPNAYAITQGQQAYYETYYTAGCPESGVVAHTCQRIIYKDVYPGIDWHIATDGVHLEHEFMVGPGADASLIKLQYQGQTALNIEKDGSLKATTPMGTITEHAPICYRPNGTLVPSNFVLQGNVLSYDMHGYQGAVVVDPTLDWGTYYGPDTSFSPLYDVACDNTGKVYGIGFTSSMYAGTIATAGSYMSTYAGGLQDWYIVKFDSSGTRLWATYYGGDGGDIGTGIAVDPYGDIYTVGTTTSTTGMATAGSHQFTYGGGSWDAALAKFNNAGTRLWSTYYGSNREAGVSNVACDLAGNVYITGETNDPNGTSTAGSFQPIKGSGLDCYLVQFNRSGIRNWGTYIGGTGTDITPCVTTDGYNLFISASVGSPGLGTPFTFHPNYVPGGSDGFVARFNSSGIRIWSTYIGGAGGENGGGITCNAAGDVFVLGSSDSDTGVASAGAYQIRPRGGTDAYVLKIHPEFGTRMWGTYYGGTLIEYVGLSRIDCDDTGNVYITGNTNSWADMATSDAHQGYYGGNNDAFLAKFTPSGNLGYSTWYGGPGDDEGNAVGFDGKSMYLCGKTNSRFNIATTDGFMPTGGGALYANQGFLAKFIANATVAGTLDAPDAAQPHHNLQLYPTIGNGVYTIEGTIIGGETEAGLSIMDMSGRVVYAETVLLSGDYFKKRIVLNDYLPAGDYLFRIVTAKNTSVLRFVKQ